MGITRWRGHQGKILSSGIEFNCLFPDWIIANRGQVPATWRWHVMDTPSIVKESQRNSKNDTTTILKKNPKCCTTLKERGTGTLAEELATLIIYHWIKLVHFARNELECSKLEPNIETEMRTSIAEHAKKQQKYILEECKEMHESIPKVTREMMI